MIAQVIVNHNSKEVDKLYDYFVPKELESSIKVGSRVTVMFGRGNSEREAFVFKLAEASKVGKLKQIISIAEGGAVFNEKMLKLIYWMRERCLCSYMDALHAIVPAGISVQPEEWLVLQNENANLKSDTNKKIVEILKDNGGGCEINYFMQFFEENVSAAVSRLCSGGVIKREYRDGSKIKEKKLRVAELAIEEEDAATLAEALKKRRAYAQSKMINILSGNDFIAVSDLVRYAESSYNAVNALEKKGYIRLKNITVIREINGDKSYEPSKPPELTSEQKTAAEKIGKSIDAEKYDAFLLHGVTGSGKTEVFMNAINRVVEKGKQALMLVPEISLTPQTVDRFMRRFGNRVAVFHSGLSLGEKYDQWRRMRDGEADIAIGARSAVFAPFDNIGIIIIDEEHEQTYKSELIPRYNAKEVAAFRARQENAVLLLASATPDVGSYYRAKCGEYKLLEMTKRANAGSMPDVRVADMRKELENGNKSIFSNMLKEEIKKNLDNKEQTILFLNRRGFSTFVSCRNCGYVAKCSTCNISLTYHKSNDTLRCHYCGHTRKNYSVCPACGSKYIRYFGGGTQRVEEEVKKLFPEASIIRMDVDTTGRKFAHEKMLEEFEKNQTDILIGTQMVAKGLDFANVTLVGVISADVMLNFDDYRSGERSFSILEQVSGRAGRAKKPGRAIVQTYSPGHMAITCMKKHDYIDFYNAEIKMREAMWYPPFCEIVFVGFAAVNENLVVQAAKYFVKMISGLDKLPQKTQILGPIPSAVSKIKNKYRRQIVIKCENSEGLNVILEEARNACKRRDDYKNVSVVIDKNPNGIV